MKAPMVRTDMSGKGLPFLLTPEDSSATDSGASRGWENNAWHLAKTAVWLLFSILAALLVGQL